MKDVMIVLQREVPPEIVRLVRDEFTPYDCVSQVIFAGNCKDRLEGRMAAFVPDTGSIIIDLDACVQDLRWMDKGATFISNAWFNLLYCIFHESDHAQMVHLGFLTKFDEGKLEESADDYALGALVDWFKVNELPKLDQMGYLCERIQKVLNAMWAKHAPVVEDEIACCGIVAARAKLAAQHNRRNAEPKTTMHPGEVDEVAALMTGIREGFVESVVIGNEPCISANNFLEMVRSI